MHHFHVLSQIICWNAIDFFLMLAYRNVDKVALTER